MALKHLTTEEVAERFRMEPQGIRRLVRLERIIAINIGTKHRPIYRFSEDDLLAYEDRQRTAVA